MSKTTIETTYDPVLHRYRVAVVRDGEILYVAVRAQREAAVFAAESFVTYQVSA